MKLSRTTACLAESLVSAEEQMAELAARRLEVARELLRRASKDSRVEKRFEWLDWPSLRAELQAADKAEAKNVAALDWRGLIDDVKAEPANPQPPTP